MKTIAAQRNEGGKRYLIRTLNQREERAEKRELRHAVEAMRAIERSMNRHYTMSEQMPAVIQLETLAEVDLMAAWRL